LKKTMAILLLVCFVSTGCTGSFNLTRKVYNMHRSQEDKWMDEVVFLVCILVPIYGISTFADAVIFNSVEFWTGENPVALDNVNKKNHYVKDQQGEATVSYNPQTDEITIASQKALEGQSVVTLQRKDGFVRAEDQQGKLLYASSVNEKGELLVYNSDLALVKSYSPQEMRAMKERYVK